MLGEIQLLLLCLTCLICLTISLIGAFIVFVNNNFWGIIFLIWLGLSIVRAFHNRNIKKKYKRDNNKYEVKRNKDDGDIKNRNAIYLVCKKKNSEDKIVWHHIINMYTLTELGYAPPSREDDYCFSFTEKDKKNIIGENIIIHNITFDFRKIDK